MYAGPALPRASDDHIGKLSRLLLNLLQLGRPAHIPRTPSHLVDVFTLSKVAATMPDTRLSRALAAAVGGPGRTAVSDNDPGS